MNCPQCEQTVYEDHFSVGPERDTFDAETGAIIGAQYDIYIDCAHCGAFHVVMDAINRCVAEKHGPFNFGRAYTAILRKLPIHAGRKLPVRDPHPPIDEQVRQPSHEEAAT